MVDAHLLELAHVGEAAIVDLAIQFRRDLDVHRQLRQLVPARDP